MLRQLRLAATDHRGGLGAVGRQRAVEARHVENGLRVLALADREVQLLLTGRPAARTVILVEVVGERRRKIGALLLGEIDASFSIEAQSNPARDKPAQRDLLAE